MELSFENLLAHINTVYILVTKTGQEKAAPSMATWRPHQEDDDGSTVQEANLRLKVNWISSF